MREGATAVLLAGDLVEREDDFFEACRELGDGVCRFMEKNTQVIAVAGNHDVKVLPRLADRVPQFRLLGRSGKREHCDIVRVCESVTLWGWPFPQARVAQSPLANIRIARQPGINLGLLRCDTGRAVQAAYDPGRRHPLAPQRRRVTVTEPLRRTLEASSKKGLETVTSVPISRNSRRRDRGPCAGLLKHESAMLETYQ